MIIRTIDGIKVLSPEDGYKFITNGETWSTEVWLGTMDKVENWNDTNEDPPEPEATKEDYQDVLETLDAETNE